jgi:endonuclease/exonuclease/phosphatase family metal-dependent hydrolase
LGFTLEPDTASFRIMFYNVENLFDTIDNPNKNDNEFLPDGPRHWNSYRFYQKLNRISQVIIAAGEPDFPVVIGMSEIENLQVLEALLHFSPLKKLNYGIVHHESPDSRGIDVALLYRKELFTPLLFRAIEIRNPKDKSYTTRDILYVKGLLAGDTVHFFVNHWPSKFGGLSISKPLRALAASRLRAETDSLLGVNERSRIIIMGDFNDTPFDNSVAGVLGAKPVSESSESNLYTLAYTLAKEGKGSNKYRSKWDMIDQFIVSGSLLNAHGLHTSPELFQVFAPDFLLIKDKNYLGEKLNRTYVWFKYNGGFSDHLPVLLDLKF